MFSVCEMPASPWHAVHVSALSLPAAGSAAWANDPQTIATDSALTKEILIATSLLSSLPGLTRQSICQKSVFILMDARIKSGHDDRDRIATTFFNKKPRPLVPEWPQLMIVQALLLAVADAIDRAGPVVGNEDRTILVQDDIVGPAEIALVAFDPAGSEHFLLGILAIRADDYAHDPSALILMPVPGAVFGDQDVVLVVGGKLVAGVELHAERSHVRAEIEHRRGEFRALVTHRKLRVRRVALVAVGIAEMLAQLRDHVELVARHVVAHPVAGVFGEPVFAVARIDVTADAVADAERHDFGVAGLGIDPADLRHPGRGNADVEGRSERNVEPAILVGREILPAMGGIGRHVVIDHLAVAELVEIGFGVVVFDQLVGGDDVKRAVAERQASGHVQALENGLDLLLAAIVLDGVDVAEAEGADEQRALVAPGHLPRRQHARRVDLDLEARRQFYLFHHRGEFRLRCAGRRTRRRCEALLGFGLVAEEPVIRGMGPEFLGAGLIGMERLLLRVGLAGPRDNDDCCERKDRSIESRFHRVTPYAAVRLRVLFILNVARDVALVC